MNVVGWEPELNFAEESWLPKIDEFTRTSGGWNTTMKDDLQNEKNKKGGDEKCYSLLSLLHSSWIKYLLFLIVCFCMVIWFLMSKWWPAGKTVITSDHALKLESVPDWIAIVGSGYIGLEFSDVYTALGSEVMSFSANLIFLVFFVAL